MALTHYNLPAQETDIIEALKAEIDVEHVRITSAVASITGKASKTQPSFTDATLTNGWVAGSSAPGYFKDEFGIVHLRGAIKSGTTLVAAFVLPSGNRPAVTCVFPVIDGANLVAQCSVDTAGNVVIGTTTANAQGFNLAPVQFKV